MKYIEKSRPVIVALWLKDGDHPLVEPFKQERGKTCFICQKTSENHGWLSMGEISNGEVVCPGDFIIDYGGGQIGTLTADELNNFYERL